MRIMFWNTYRNITVNQVICDIAKERNIDIIALAEYQANYHALISDLNMQPYITLGCNKIRLIGRKENVTPGAQGDRYSIQIIDNQYILCALHLPSQINGGNQGRRNIVIQSVLKDIKEIENKLNTKYSIVCGDFNEDPYDEGCLSAMNFHGLPFINDATRSYRVIEGQQFEMFYNPMWNLFGDFDSPPGTYYYTGSDPKCSYWHIFDQVMFRNCLKEKFVKESLEIIIRAGDHMLLDCKGRPNKHYSDHLPIVFEMQEDLS